VTESWGSRRIDDVGDPLLRDETGDEHGPMAIGEAPDRLTVGGCEVTQDGDLDSTRRVDLRDVTGDGDEAEPVNPNETVCGEI